MVVFRGEGAGHGEAGRFLAGDRTAGIGDRTTPEEGESEPKGQLLAEPSDAEVKSREAIDHLVRLNRERIATIEQRVQQAMREGKRTEELRSLLRVHRASLRTLLEASRPAEHGTSRRQRKADDCPS